MRIVVIGGSGRVGTQLVDILRSRGRSVVVAAPSHGVDAVTGEGLDRALEGAEVVIDVSNPPSLEGDVAFRFFESAGRRLAAAGRAAGVRHHVVLSVIGTGRLQSGYFRAKALQEDLVRLSGLPFSILRSTQFFEFIARVVQGGGADRVAIAPAQVQPVATQDVATALADLATSVPLDTVAEIAGPERFRLTDLAVEVLTAYEDARRVVADPQVPYFGAVLQDASLLPGRFARTGERRFEDWLRASLQPRTPPT